MQKNMRLDHMIKIYPKMLRDRAPLSREEEDSSHQAEQIAMENSVEEVEPIGEIMTIETFLKQRKGIDETDPYFLKWKRTVEQCTCGDHYIKGEYKCDNCNKVLQSQQELEEAVVRLANELQLVTSRLWKGQLQYYSTGKEGCAPRERGLLYGDAPQGCSTWLLHGGAPRGCSTGCVS